MTFHFNPPLVCFVKRYKLPNGLRISGAATKMVKNILPLMVTENACAENHAQLAASALMRWLGDMAATGFKH